MQKPVGKRVATCLSPGTLRTMKKSSMCSSYADHDSISGLNLAAPAKLAISLSPFYLVANYVVYLKDEAVAHV